MQIRSLVGNVLVAAGGDHLIGHQAGAVQQIERLAGGQLGIDVEQRDLAHDPAGLQGKRRARADQSAAADNADFHGSSSFSSVSCVARVYLLASAAITRSVIVLTSAS